MKMKSTRAGSFISSHKKLMIITSAVLIFLIILGAYAAWSIATWRAYDETSMAAPREVRSSLDSSLKLAAQTGEDRSKKLGALKTVQDDIAAKKDLCDVQVLIEWQSSFEHVKRLKEKCLSARQSLENLGVSLERVVHYLEDEKRMTEVIAPLQTEGELDEQVWKQLAANWLEAGKKLSELKPGEEFKPVLSIVKERTEGVAARWQELQIAHEAKDRVRFEKATDELKKAYGILKATVDDTASTFASLEKQFADSYAAAFN